MHAKFLIIDHEIIELASSQVYGGWFVPCRISVFLGRKREKAPRKTPPNGDFFVFSHGDLSPRHTKVRDILRVAFSPTDCGVFAWRGERSPRENTPNGDFSGFSRGDLSPRQAKIRQTGGEKATHEKCRSFAWRGERSSRENTKKWPFGGLSCGAFSPFRPENTIIRQGTNQPPYKLEMAR